MADRWILMALVSEFGALVAMWLLAPYVSPPIAFIGALLFVGLNAWRRRAFGLSRPWLILNGLALGLAAMAVAVEGRPIATYEGALGNVLCALAFFIGAFGKRSLVQEFAEARHDTLPDVNHSALHSFCRAYTLIWSMFFMARAAVETWAVSRHLDVGLLRIAMPLSLVAMLGLSFKGPWLFRMARRGGLIRPGALEMQP